MQQANQKDNLVEQYIKQLTEKAKDLIEKQKGNYVEDTKQKGKWSRHIALRFGQGLRHFESQSFLWHEM